MIHIHIHIQIHTQIHDYVSYTHRYTYAYILMCIHALICTHIIYPNISIQGISHTTRAHTVHVRFARRCVFNVLCIHCKHRSVCNVFAILWIYLQCVCNTQRVHMEFVCNLFAMCYAFIANTNLFAMCSQSYGFVCNVSVILSVCI